MCSTGIVVLGTGLRTALIPALVLGARLGVGHVDLSLRGDKGSAGHRCGDRVCPGLRDDLPVGKVGVHARQREILPQGMVRVAVPHEDPPEVGMPGEADAEHVESLALVPVGSVPERHHARHLGGGVVAAIGGHPDVFVARR